MLDNDELPTEDSPERSSGTGRLDRLASHLSLSPGRATRDSSGAAVLMGKGDKVGGKGGGKDWSKSAWGKGGPKGEGGGKGWKAGDGTWRQPPKAPPGGALPKPNLPKAKAPPAMEATPPATWEGSRPRGASRPGPPPPIGLPSLEAAEQRAAARAAAERVKAAGAGAAAAGPEGRPWPAWRTRDVMEAASGSGSRGAGAEARQLVEDAARRGALETATRQGEAGWRESQRRAKAALAATPEGYELRTLPRVQEEAARESDPLDFGRTPAARTDPRAKPPATPPTAGAAKSAAGARPGPRTLGSVAVPRSVGSAAFLEPERADSPAGEEEPEAPDPAAEARAAAPGTPVRKLLRTTRRQPVQDPAAEVAVAAEPWTFWSAYRDGMGRVPVPEDHPLAYRVPWNREGCVRLVAGEAPPANVENRVVRNAIRFASLLPTREDLPGHGELDRRLALLDLGQGKGVFPGGPNMTRAAWEEYLYPEAVVLARWAEYLDGGWGLDDFLTSTGDSPVGVQGIGPWSCFGRADGCRAKDGSKYKFESEQALQSHHRWNTTSAATHPSDVAQAAWLVGDRWPHELPEEVWPSFARLPWEAGQRALTQDSADRLALAKREKEAADAQALAAQNQGELKIHEETRHLWRRVWHQALGELTVESPELPWAAETWPPELTGGMTSRLNNLAQAHFDVAEAAIKETWAELVESENVRLLTLARTEPHVVEAREEAAALQFQQAQRILAATQQEEAARRILAESDRRLELMGNVPDPLNPYAGAAAAAEDFALPGAAEAEEDSLGRRWVENWCAGRLPFPPCLVVSRDRLGRPAEKAYWRAGDPGNWYSEPQPGQYQAVPDTDKDLLLTEWYTFLVANWPDEADRCSMELAVRVARSLVYIWGTCRGYVYYPWGRKEIGFFLLPAAGPGAADPPAWWSLMAEVAADLADRGPTLGGPAESGTVKDWWPRQAMGVHYLDDPDREPVRIPSRDAEDRATYTDLGYDPVGYASHKTFESVGIEGQMDPRLLRVEGWRPDTYVYRHYVSPESFESRATHGEWTERVVARQREEGAIADFPWPAAPEAPAEAPPREADSPAAGAPPPGVGAVDPKYWGYYKTAGWDWEPPAERGPPPAGAPDAWAGYGAQEGQQRHGSRSPRGGGASWRGADGGAGRAGTPAARHPDAASSSSSSAERSDWSYTSFPHGYSEVRRPAPPAEAEAERGTGGEGTPSRPGPAPDEEGGAAAKGGGKTWLMSREREYVAKRRTTGEGATRVVEEEGIEKVREEIGGTEHFAAVVPAGGGYRGVVAVAQQVWPWVAPRDQELVRRYRARVPLSKADSARLAPLVAIEDGENPSGYKGIGIPPQFRIPAAPLPTNATGQVDCSGAVMWGSEHWPVEGMGGDYHPLRLGPAIPAGTLTMLWKKHGSDARNTENWNGNGPFMTGFEATALWELETQEVRAGLERWQGGHFGPAPQLPGNPGAATGGILPCARAPPGTPPRYQCTQDANGEICWAAKQGLACVKWVTEGRVKVQALGYHENRRNPAGLRGPLVLREGASPQAHAAAVESIAARQRVRDENWREIRDAAERAGREPPRRIYGPRKGLRPAPEWVALQEPAYQECAAWAENPASSDWRPKLRRDLRGVPTQDVLDGQVQEAVAAGRDPWCALHRPDMEPHAEVFIPDSFVVGF